MAKYPIKMLKDEEGTPFVPLISLDSVQDATGQSINEILDKKLEIKNIIAGTQIELEVDGNNITISNSAEGTKLINNLETEQVGLGALDAHQGKVLLEKIPVIANNLNTPESGQALSAYQGYVLAGRVAPTGGAAGQVLKKSSDSDYSFEWGDAADPNAIVGDGSIKRIIELTYEEYQALETIDPDTEYHIIDAQSAIDNLQATLDNLQLQITTLKNSLKPVSTTGSYNDLIEKPFEINSNENGNYIKYTDGTLICYKKVEITNIEITGSWGQLYESPLIDLGNWPMSFIDNPITSLTPVADYGLFPQGHNSVTNTKAGTIWLTRGTPGKLDRGYISVVGFGRWK